jgi:regulatory protein
MKIIKYEKKGNNKYKIHLENNESINVYEDVIIKNNLLYKKELDRKLLEKIDNDNSNFDAYNKCVKYISVRIRSEHEIEEYLKKKELSSTLIEETIDKLKNNNLLNDDIFARAFVNDKIKFTTMGPYRIEQELKKHHIDSNIIYKYLNEIDDFTIDEKIDKQINKLIKSSRKKQNLRNKIYMNLLSLGYSNEMILRNLNNYDFSN